ncbi:N-acetylmuramoyl-L-alanine amidase [Anaerotignum sp.]|uniref:N-acetylmuramoyl-L-alanine amidase family protein n=1 Tax=Anaerotignum sp. TaxID=2039241 RepID=UPI003735271A
MLKRFFLILVGAIFLCIGCNNDSSMESQKNYEATAKAQSAQVASEPRQKEKLLEGRMICVDPGHCVTPEMGKGEQEPISPLSTETKPKYAAGTSGANITEEQLNLAVGLQLKEALEEQGAEVVMTREISEITISNIERCELAHEAGADVAIHIHADGNNDSSVHGISVLVPSGDLLGTPSITEESSRLGQLMVDAVAEQTGAKNRGISPRTDMVAFNHSEIPTVLIEMGFLTNPEEEKLLETEEYQSKIVDGMVKALLEWYENK